MKRTLIAFLLIFTSLIKGMDQTAQAIDTNRDQQSEALKWPAELYDNAYQGAQYNLYESDEQVRNNALKECREITQEKTEADSWDFRRRMICDWLFAHCKAQEDYGSKPFETWTVADICQLAAHINRLTIRRPGEFRQAPSLDDEHKKFILAIIYGDITAEQHARFNAIVENPTHSSEDLEFVRSIAYIFPRAETIPTHASEALAKIQHFLKEAKSVTEPIERTNKIKEAGSLAHHEIMKLWAFTDGNKRLARLIMNIIYVQNGILPITVHNATAYIIAIKASFYENTHVPFYRYISRIFALYEASYTPVLPELHYASTTSLMEQITGQMQAEKSADADLAANNALTILFQNQSSSITDEQFSKILSQLFGQNQSVELVTEQSQAAQAAAAAQSTKTAKSKQKAHAAKTSIAQQRVVQKAVSTCASCGKDNPQSQCSRCHSALYCSQTCQREAWPTHKKECSELAQKLHTSSPTS